MSFCCLIEFLGRKIAFRCLCFEGFRDRGLWSSDGVLQDSVVVELGIVSCFGVFFGFLFFFSGV